MSGMRPSFYNAAAADPDFNGGNLGLPAGARRATLVNLLTLDEFPLAHGANVFGRDSKKAVGAGTTRLPLLIPASEANISRHQATLTVANHADGIRVTLQTHRAAKNATRLRRSERFGTKRSHLLLKPGEAVPVKHGDILEMDSVASTAGHSGSSFAFRLDVTGQGSAKLGANGGGGAGGSSSHERFLPEEASSQANFAHFQRASAAAGDEPTGEDALAALAAALDVDDEHCGSEEEGGYGTEEDEAQTAAAGEEEDEEKELLEALRAQDRIEVTSPEQRQPRSLPPLPPPEEEETDGAPGVGGAGSIADKAGTRAGVRRDIYIGQREAGMRAAGQGGSLGSSARSGGASGSGLPPPRDPLALFWAVAGSHSMVELVAEGLGVLAEEASGAAGAVARDLKQLPGKAKALARRARPTATANAHAPQEGFAAGHRPPLGSPCHSWPPPAAPGSRRAEAQALAAEAAAVACRLRCRLMATLGGRGVRAPRLEGGVCGDAAAGGGYFPVWLPKPGPAAGGAAGAPRPQRGPALALRLIQCSSDDGDGGDGGLEEEEDGEDDDEAWLSVEEEHRRAVSKARASTAHWSPAEHGVVYEAIAFAAASPPSAAASAAQAEAALLPSRVLPLRRLTRAAALTDGSCLLTLAFGCSGGAEEVLSVVCASAADAACAAATLCLLAALPPPLPPRRPCTAAAPEDARAPRAVPLAPLLAARGLARCAPLLASRLGVRTVGGLARATPQSLAAAGLKPCHRRKCALLLAAHAAACAEHCDSAARACAVAGSDGGGKGGAARDAFRGWLAGLRAATAALKATLAEHPAWLLDGAPVVA